MLLLVTVTSADTDTHSYNSNLEFGLRVLTVTHAKPLDSNMNVEIVALLQSSNSGRDTAQASTSPRQLQPSPLRGAPTETPLQPYRGSSSSSKHPRHAAGISLSSDNLFGLSVHLTTFWMVHSLLQHYLSF